MVRTVHESNQKRVSIPKYKALKSLGKMFAPLVTARECPQFLMNLVHPEVRTLHHTRHGEGISPPLWTHTESLSVTASTPSHTGWWDCGFVSCELAITM